jgi:hypothetical protein
MKRMKSSYGIDLRVDAYAAQGTARRMCEHKDINVVFDLKPGTNPVLIGKTMHMPPANPLMTNEEMNDWWGGLIHLTRHATPRGQQGTNVLKSKKVKEDSLEEHILTMMEDTVVDSIGVGEYLGQDETASVHAAKQWENVTSRKFKKELWNNPELDEASIVAATSIATACLARQAYQPDLRGVETPLLEDDSLNPEVKRRLLETIDGGWVDELIDLQEEGRTAEEVYEWTQRWMTEVHHQPPPPPPQPSEGEGEGDEGKEGEEDKDSSGSSGASSKEGKGEEKDSREQDGKQDKDSGEGKGKQESEPKQTQASNDTERPDVKLSKAAKLLFEEVERDTHSPVDLETISDSRHDAEIEYSYQRSRKYTPAPASYFKVIDYPAGIVFNADGTKTNASMATWTGKGYRDITPRNPSDTLASQVKRHIQSETRTRIDRNKKKGKIDQRKLYKLGVKNASKDWQERVFHQRSNKLTVKETKVSLLCDMSGSMGGSKIVTAAKCMDLFGDVCHTLNVDYEMAGFSTGSTSDCVIHTIFKPFGVNVQRSKIMESMQGATNHMNGNADGENIWFAYQRLRAQEAKRRILIVLSDGQPAAHGGDIRQYTASVTEGIENEGIVELHGIGILSDAVQDYYASYSVIDDTEQLEAALLGVLKNTLVKLK